MKILIFLILGTLIGTEWHMLGLFQSTSWARWLAFIGIFQFQFQLRAWPFVASTREKLHLAEKNRPLKWTLPRRSVVRSKTLRMAACRFLSACHARWRNQASLPTSAGDASGGCGRAFGASAPADCCAVCCCQRQRAGAIGDWCVAARGRASLARQSWMPCGCSGRPRLGPASASS